jgi:hypothetical protein
MTFDICDADCRGAIYWAKTSNFFYLAKTMFVERKVHYSALFTNLVMWQAGAVGFPPSDVILAQLACPLSDIMFCLHSGRTNLLFYKHWAKVNDVIFKTIF